MLTLFGLLLGCYAHAHDVHSHHHGCGHQYDYVVHTHSASRWIPGYYDSRGLWVPGQWVSYNYRSVPPPMREACHRHRDGRSHCGRHR